MGVVESARSKDERRRDGDVRTRGGRRKQRADTAVRQRAMGREEMTIGRLGW